MLKLSSKTGVNLLVVAVIFYSQIDMVNIPIVIVILQVPIKWPQSRDEVWKANIPHTHLAHEKSDQNWMVEKGEKISFPGGGTHFHYGADKYIASIANVRLLPRNCLCQKGLV